MNPSFRNLFMTRNIRIEEELIDQFFNSTLEERTCKPLLTMAMKDSRSCGVRFVEGRQTRYAG
jgi:hypothetical protein